MFRARGGVMARACSLLRSPGSPENREKTSPKRSSDCFANCAKQVTACFLSMQRSPTFLDPGGGVCNCYKHAVYETQDNLHSRQLVIW